MGLYAWQVQRSPNGTTWADIGGAVGSFTATPPFTEDVLYDLVPADTGDYLRLRLTDPVGTIFYSPNVGPIA